MSSIEIQDNTTEEKPIEIRSISREDACKISSGQVISSLAIAVKELVENSLDAGATLIEVKFKEMGLQGVEVADNGCGVKSEDFQALTARHATSKLHAFNELEEVQTFGFRGEALNSLCALGDIVIVTKHESASHASRLEFDHAGNIAKQTPSAGSVGTSVQLTNLFAMLPVRKREFHKNFKKEYGKAIEIITAYCLVSQKVRIVCTNQTKQGVRTQVLQTNANSTTVINIQALFGQKQMEQLVEIKPPKLGTEDDMRLEKYEIEGWVSDCHHGSGRSSKDRQFFFINSRPCESKSIVKFINEVYRRFNPHQYPFIFLNIKMDKKDVDINVTPDKRQLYVSDERVLKLAIEKCLSTTYESMQQVFRIKTIKPFFTKSTSKSNEAQIEKTELDSEDDQDSDCEIAVGDPKKYSQMLSQWKTTGDTSEACSPEKKYKRKFEDEIAVRTLKIRKIQEALEKTPGMPLNLERETDSHYKYISDEDDEDNANDAKSYTYEHDEYNYNSYEKGILTPIGSKEVISQGTAFKITIVSPKKKSDTENVELIRSKSANNESEIEVKRIDCKTKSPLVQRKLETIPKAKYDNILDKKKTSLLESSSKQPSTSRKIKSKLPISLTLHNAKKTLRTSFDQIKTHLKAETNARESYKSKAAQTIGKFQSKINPTNNDSAEAELRREVSKDMFLKMEIIGQFNLGFIIVRLDDDLFIIDQHASAEKYNFEDLSKNTVIQTQQMVCAQQLELTATNEMILIDNLPIFERNGFKFKINHDALPTKKVSLISKPYSKNWDFGKEDIEEMIHMLYEAPNVLNIRPSRVRAMFASRACRKSVMIGDPLTKGQMKKIVDGMSTLDQPWNCPHGRPTMRHLVNLNSLKESQE